MAKGQNIIQSGAGRKPPVAAGGDGPVVAVKKRVGVVQFLREVDVERRKVTWTGWKETWITSVMVGIMVIFTAIFFFAVDWFLGMGIGALLKLANAE